MGKYDEEGYPITGSDRVDTEALDTLDREIDDLIMRLKDCISHENNHNFTDRCITKVQFKQPMKAKLQQYVDSECLRARRDELEKIELGLSAPRPLIRIKYIREYVKERLSELNTGGNKDEICSSK